MIGHRPNSSSNSGIVDSSNNSLLPSNSIIRPNTSNTTNNSNITQFKALQCLTFTDAYEMVFALPRGRRESVQDCDVGKFGSFRLQCIIRFAERDMVDIRREAYAISIHNPVLRQCLDKGEFTCNIEAYTNKTQLSALKVIVSSQIGFNGAITKVRDIYVYIICLIMYYTLHISYEPQKVAHYRVHAVSRTIMWRKVQ